MIKKVINNKQIYEFAELLEAAEDWLNFLDNCDRRSRSLLAASGAIVPIPHAGVRMDLLASISGSMPHS